MYTQKQTQQCIFSYTVVQECTRRLKIQRQSRIQYMIQGICLRMQSKSCVCSVQKRLCGEGHRDTTYKQNKISLLHRTHSLSSPHGGEWLATVLPGQQHAAEIKLIEHNTKYLTGSQHVNTIKSDNLWKCGRMKQQAPFNLHLPWYFLVSCTRNTSRKRLGQEFVVASLVLLELPARCAAEAPGSIAAEAISYRKLVALQAPMNSASEHNGRS